MKITYDELRRIHRLERNTSKLVDVDEDFISSIEEFAEEEKKKYLESLKNFSSGSSREFTNLKRVVEEIFLMRKKKILNKALIASHTSDINFENMANEEKDFFKDLLKIIEDYNKHYVNLFGEKETKSEDSKVKILKDVPTFVGTDMKEYGPFKEGEEVSLPAKVAKLFVKRKIAEEN
jgi:DNA replication initiation complex subunit (GINS family)